jgi:hypothetical protein
MAVHPPKRQSSVTYHCVLARSSEGNVYRVTRKSVLICGTAAQVTYRLGQGESLLLSPNQVDLVVSVTGLRLRFQGEVLGPY